MSDDATGGLAAAMNRGRAHHSAGRLVEAEASYRQVLAAEPGHPEALHLLGGVALQQGKNALAVEFFEKAIAANARSAEYHNNLAIAHQSLGALDAAEAAFRQAIALQPEYAEAHFNLGGVFLQQDKLEDAMAACQSAVALRPDYAEAHNNLGIALKDLGQLEDAVAAFRRALVAKSDYTNAYSNLGNALKHQGKLEDALAAFRTAVDLKPGLAEAHSNLLYCLLYRPDYDRAEIFAEHRKWNARHAAPLAPKAGGHDNPPIADKRLRLGLVSHHFRRHPVGYFTVSALEALDRSAFELYCYADTRQSDDLTERTKQTADAWRRTEGTGDEDIAALIRDDAIDILIDMSGHGAGSRLLVFARKPAPVQVKWVGAQIDTTGMDAMDYFISDSVHSAPEDAPWYSEELVRLPDGYVCYAPPDYAPAVTALPALVRGHVTFGCFNNLAKINRPVIALWSALLGRVATSRLVLKTRQFNDAAVRAHYRPLFQANGIAPGRLDLLGESPHAELLAHYNEIDIALDPFPYCGGLTTCEALWMGVPVVTMSGEAFAHRHAASHLTNVGLSDWVVKTPAQYLDLAARKSSDPHGLASLRAGLRQRVGQSPLCDAPRFAHNLEAALRRMWRTWCAAQSRPRR